MVGVVKVNDTFSLHAIELCDILSKALFLGEIDGRDRLSLTFINIKYLIICTVLHIHLRTCTVKWGKYGKWGICDDNCTRGGGGLTLFLKKK